MLVIRQRAGMAGVRNKRTFREGVANGTNRPFADLPDRACERAKSARKRTSDEGVGCVQESFATSTYFW